MFAGSYNNPPPLSYKMFHSNLGRLSQAPSNPSPSPSDDEDEVELEESEDEAALSAAAAVSGTWESRKLPIMWFHKAETGETPPF